VYTIYICLRPCAPANALARLGRTQLDAGDLPVLDDPLLVGNLCDEGLVLGDGHHGALKQRKEQIRGRDRLEEGTH